MYYDLLEQLKDFTDEQFGKFTRILIKYDKDGIMPEFEDLQLKVAFQMLKPKMDRNKEHYGVTCETVYDHNKQYDVDYEEENRRNQLIDGCPF